MRNSFLRNGFVFDRNFFEILKIFCSQSPEDLVLEWFRHRNGPDGQVIKSASIDPKSSTKAHLRSRQRFWGVWGAQNGAGLRDLGVRPFLGSPQVGYSGCVRDFAAPGHLFLIEISRNAKRREASVFESHFEKYVLRASGDGTREEEGGMLGAGAPRHTTLSFYCSIIPHSSRGAFDLFTMY